MLFSRKLKGICVSFLKTVSSSILIFFISCFPLVSFASECTFIAMKSDSGKEIQVSMTADCFGELKNKDTKKPQSNCKPLSFFKEKYKKNYADFIYGSRVMILANSGDAAIIESLNINGKRYQYNLLNYSMDDFSAEVFANVESPSKVMVLKRDGLNIEGNLLTFDFPNRLLKERSLPFDNNKNATTYNFSRCF